MHVSTLPSHARQGLSEAEITSEPLVIAFVNNMPDAAIRSSERQFRGLLQASAGSLKIEVKGFYYSEVERAGTVKTNFLQSYSDTDELWGSKIDGLIVTGAEPRAQDLTSEPYWPLLARLTSWAEENTVASIWSCMAAHAAVYRLAGIKRMPLDEKLSGLYECRKTLDHPLMEGIPSKWFVPQSRYNGLPEEELLDSGFEALTKLDAGLDTFILRRKSLFVFFQGHPEYDAETLLLEYIRDVRRFVEGERETYPNPPEAYFDFETLEQLQELREQAFRKRDQESYVAVTRLLQGHKIQNIWKSPSTTLYGNWLRYIQNEKVRAKSLAFS